jgi:23S rRNA (cytosine1962-C5)-methyltransferase
MKSLTIRSKHNRRVEEGHPWVFANEVADDLSQYEPGEPVLIRHSSGRLYGTGYVNPRSLIAARVMVRREVEAFDEVFFEERLRRALHVREALYGGSSTYRLVHSEGDELPGLVVDRYGGTLAVEILTAGMERLRGPLLAALDSVLAPGTIVLKNDSPFRVLEGLPSGVEVAKGRHEDPIEAEWLDGLRLRANLLSGQKTGLYLDQRDNLAALRRYLKPGAEVLDAFCYVGAWSLACARWGAVKVLGVDRSEEAVALATHNAGEAGLEKVCEFKTQDALSALKELHDEKRRFDVVLLDPPSFARSRKDVAAAKAALIDFNRRASRLVRPGGLLVTSTCSHHIERETFRDILAVAMRKAGRRGVLLEMRSQSADHPVVLHVPESEYLKCAFLRVEEM